MYNFHCNSSFLSMKIFCFPCVCECTKAPFEIIYQRSLFFSLFPNWSRKLSLNYLQLHASGAKLYRDDGSRRRNPKRHGNEISYDNISSMSRQATLSKNDMNSIRRSNVLGEPASLSPLNF